MAYIERTELRNELYSRMDFYSERGAKRISQELSRLIKYIDEMPTAEVVEVVRCKDCEYHHWEQEPEHGKTVHICSVVKAEVFKDFYCYYGKHKTSENALKERERE